MNEPVIAMDLAQEDNERNAFQIRCPSCQKLYTGQWQARVCVQLMWLDCSCGVRTRLSGVDTP